MNVFDCLSPTVLQVRTPRAGAAQRSTCTSFLLHYSPLGIPQNTLYRTKREEAAGLAADPNRKSHSPAFSGLKRETCITKCLFFPYIKEDLSGAPIWTENFCSSKTHFSECKLLLCLTLWALTLQIKSQGSYFPETQLLRKKKLKGDYWHVNLYFLLKARKSSSPERRDLHTTNHHNKRNTSERTLAAVGNTNAAAIPNHVYKAGNFEFLCGFFIFILKEFIENKIWLGMPHWIKRICILLV